jgi:hypothetical protein
LLAGTLRDLMQNRQQLRDWGAAGRNYVERFEQRKVLEKFVVWLERLFAVQ